MNLVVILTRRALLLVVLFYSSCFLPVVVHTRRTSHSPCFVQIDSVFRPKSVLCTDSVFRPKSVPRSMLEQSTSKHKSFEQLSLDRSQLEYQSTLDRSQLEYQPSIIDLPLLDRPSSDRLEQSSIEYQLSFEQYPFGPEKNYPDSLFWEIKRLSALIDPFLSSEEDLIMSQSESLFTFCGCFGGKGTISVARWLLKLEHELTQYRENGTIPPDRFINSINLLLTDDAAEWAETN